MSDDIYEDGHEKILAGIGPGDIYIVDAEEARQKVTNNITLLNIKAISCFCE